MLESVDIIRVHNSRKNIVGMLCVYRKRISMYNCVGKVTIR